MFSSVSSVSSVFAIFTTLATLALAVPAPEATPPPPAAQHPANCVHTVLRVPSFTLGPTDTVWTETATTTLSVDCRGCNSATESLMFIGVGPVFRPTTTVTATEPTLVTAYACALQTAN